MKPLKILLGNNTLALLAGSETWTYTLALELKKMGHSVTCYAPQLGVISDKLINEGIRCFDNLNVGELRPFSILLEEVVDYEYDVVIANHNHVVDYIRMCLPRVPIISTIHGIIHFGENEKGEKIMAPEHPALESGVAEFISVSEEVKDILEKEYQIESSIIRNFFDITRFSKLRTPSLAGPKQFLINTNYNGRDDEEIKIVREVVKHYGAKLTAIGVNFAPSIDVTKAIEDADVVIGMGRSVLEGVAAGRLGIVHGRWGTGGIICESNIEVLRSCNFSGRNSDGEFMTAEEMIAEIDRYYNPENLEWGKNYIAREHNVVFAAEEYVRRARQLTGEMFTKPMTEKVTSVDPEARPFRLAKDVK